MNETTGRRRLAIVGGGVSGVAAFAAAVRYRVAASIELVDPTGIGQGVAFSPTHDELLCNTSTETMSILADDDEDFLRYVRAQGMEFGRESFVPRRCVAGYLANRYALWSTRASAAGIRHRRIQSAARDIRRLPEGGYSVELDNGVLLNASDVLVCNGHGAPALPELLRPYVAEPGFFACLYPEREVLEALPTGARVAVLGSRLSAVDAALLLCGAGHIVMLASPSGRLPAVRTATPRACPVTLPDSAFDHLDPLDPVLPRKVLRVLARSARAVGGLQLRSQIDRSTHTMTRLRLEVALANAGVTDWQTLLVRAMDVAEKRLRHIPPVRISANVTDDFGNVTGLEPVLELREEDCRFEDGLAGLTAPGWSSARSQ